MQLKDVVLLLFILHINTFILYSKNKKVYDMFI